MIGSNFSSFQASATESLPPEIAFIHQVINFRWAAGNRALSIVSLSAIASERQSIHKLAGFHPQSMDENSVVFLWEMSNFSQGQGNQGHVRRRTPYVAPAKPQIDAEVVEKDEN